MKTSEYIAQEIEKAEQIEDVDMSSELQKIARNATQKFGHKIAFEHVGGFGSPGYDVDHYAFGYVEDGDVKITSYSVESY